MYLDKGNAQAVMSWLDSVKDMKSLSLQQGFTVRDNGELKATGNWLIEIYLEMTIKMVCVCRV